MIAQTDGTDTLRFVYDSNGSPVYMEYNGTVYYYEKNLQGDIVGILDTSGTTVVQYSYDIWGKLLGINGELADTVGTANPLRYRGYYYDTETELYYLQSRYYSPDLMRFISQDDPVFSNAQGESWGSNLYAYCLNNPVVNSDPAGLWRIPLSALKNLFVFLGINPIASVLIGMGVYKIKLLLMTKFTLFIAKLGAFWGPVVQGILLATAVITGVFILEPIIENFADAILQRKKGIEITLKKTWFGLPYGIAVSTY